MNGDLGRRVFAELAGTALLVAFGAGTVLVALGGHRQFDYAGLRIIALSFALVIAVAVCVVGATSGALRPASWASSSGSRWRARSLVIRPIGGGPVNPARTFGPYLATDILGGSTPRSNLGGGSAGGLGGSRRPPTTSSSSQNRPPLSRRPRCRKAPPAT